MPLQQTATISNSYGGAEKYQAALGGILIGKV